MMQGLEKQMKYIKMMNLKKPAFTMLELVFVIVVLGILAAMALPRFDRDLRQGAKDNILAAISLTQHIALVDNQVDPTVNNWQKALWQIRFSNPGGEWLYTVASNSDYGTNIDQNESAIDPGNGKYMHSSNASPADSDESPNIFLTKLYGIDTVTFNNCTGVSGSTAQHIAFDHLGRPHRGVTGSGSYDYRTLITNSDCIITFGFIDNSITNLNITIARETGYVSGD